MNVARNRELRFGSSGTYPSRLGQQDDLDEIWHVSSELVVQPLLVQNDYHIHCNKEQTTNIKPVVHTSTAAKVTNIVQELSGTLQSKSAGTQEVQTLRAPPQENEHPLMFHWKTQTCCGCGAHPQPTFERPRSVYKRLVSCSAHPSARVDHAPAVTRCKRQIDLTIVRCDTQ